MGNCQESCSKVEQSQQNIDEVIIEETLRDDLEATTSGGTREILPAVDGTREKSGWVKKPRKEGGWSDRYVLLTRTHLVMRRSDTCAGNTHRIAISSCAVEVLGDVLTVHGPNKSVAFTSPDIESWVSALEDLRADNPTRVAMTPPVLKEGWVKKPRKAGGWSERYAVLTDLYLELRRSSRSHSLSMCDVSSEPSSTPSACPCHQESSTKCSVQAGTTALLQDRCWTPRGTADPNPNLIPNPIPDPIPSSNPGPIPSSNPGPRPNLNPNRNYNPDPSPSPSAIYP